MAYNAKEIWIPCDTVQETLGAKTVESTAVAVLSGTTGIARGLLFGVHGKIETGSTGSVVIKLYNDSDKTLELYSVSLDFDSVDQASDVMASPIPMFETPYYTTTSDDDSETKDLDTTFYVKALA